jgi:hypothetical protein
MFTSTTLGITGVSAVGSVGAVTGTNDYFQTLTGVEAGGFRGTVFPAIAAALSGNQANGSAGIVVSYTAGAGVVAYGSFGTVIPSSTNANSVNGVVATGNVGTVTPLGGEIKDLTGVAAAGTVGTIAPGFAVALTGNQAAAAVASVNKVISIALAGAAARGAVGDMYNVDWTPINTSEQGDWVLINTS